MASGSCRLRRISGQRSKPASVIQRSGSRARRSSLGTLGTLPGGQGPPALLGDRRGHGGGVGQGRGPAIEEGHALARALARAPARARGEDMGARTWGCPRSSIIRRRPGSEPRSASARTHRTGRPASRASAIIGRARAGLVARPPRPWWPRPRRRAPTPWLVVGHRRPGSPRGAIGPSPRQVEPPVHQRPPPAAGAGGEHAHPTHAHPTYAHPTGVHPTGVHPPRPAVPDARARRRARRRARAPPGHAHAVRALPRGPARAAVAASGHGPPSPSTTSTPASSPSASVTRSRTRSREPRRPASARAPAETGCDGACPARPARPASIQPVLRSARPQPSMNAPAAAPRLGSAHRRHDPRPQRAPRARPASRSAPPTTPPPPGPHLPSHRQTRPSHPGEHNCSAKARGASSGAASRRRTQSQRSRSVPTASATQAKPSASSRASSPRAISQASDSPP